MLQAGLNSDDWRDVFAAGRDAAIGEAGAVVVEGLLNEVMGVADADAREGIMVLASGIDAGTTAEEYDLMLAKINSVLAEHDARIRDFEYRIRFVEDETRSNRRSIEQLRREQDLLQRRFQEDLERVDLEITSLRARQFELEQNLVEEARERRRRDAELQRGIVGNRAEIEVNRVQIQQVYSWVSPVTRNTTAAQLAASGAEALLRKGDLVDATRVLQLSLAYDKLANKHVDPGVRYYLAVAYRRAGDMTRAEEMLVEAVTAERFRRTADWFARLEHEFQGEDRLWVESIRRDPRIGVKSPREVVIYRNTRSPEEK